jgi:glycerol kinase
MMKSTYGTGCFVLLNTGGEATPSRNRLLTTVACRLDGQASYALEGSIFIAGAAIQWLRDGLGVIETAGESETLARSLEANDGVYLVPAFTGLGAPWWDPDARGTLVGLTRNAGRAHLARAALEAACYQTWDLMKAFRSDYDGRIDRVRVDGGMAANDWMLQFLSDVTDLPVERPHTVETTALGAAMLAGVGYGLWQSLDEAADALWRRGSLFEPGMRPEERTACRKGWSNAVSRTLSDMPESQREPR